ncbi:antitoxin [Desulfonatronovibrio magnus]|uniref:antitoxin n=1 Tax=Desulfonatronovibrio magnus TaxID=698827 RepID=UPI0005EAF117|nr:AbrB family transcriptional regulator [Desulfonatronovibrio magnus]
MQTTKVIWTEHLQAIVLPQEYQFDADQVKIRRQDNTLIIEPLPDNWDWLDGVIGPLDEDFEQALSEKPAAQDRAELDFFK